MILSRHFRAVANSVANIPGMPWVVRKQLYCWIGVRIDKGAYIERGGEHQRIPAVVSLRRLYQQGLFRRGRGRDLNRIRGQRRPKGRNHHIDARSDRQPSPRASKRVINAPVLIGNGCWIGARACLLPGAEIGDGCVVAAGAVVTKTAEPKGFDVTPRNSSGNN